MIVDKNFDGLPYAVILQSMAVETLEEEHMSKSRTKNNGRISVFFLELCLEMIKLISLISLLWD